jgi:predicted translin family RNA/ssDNA-binding protein
MKTPPAFLKIGKSYTAWQVARRSVQKKANDALNKSKRAIFALHRDDMKAAEKLLDEVIQLFISCEKLFKKFPKLANEGSYKAALEEYAEAQLYSQYRQTGKFGTLENRAMDTAVYIGGLSDATGEVVRYALREATKGNAQAVHHAFETVEMTIEFLLSLDLTGALRNKFDQAKRNHRNLEKMLYELSLK